MSLWIKHDRVSISFKNEPLQTQQHQKDDCDINRIVADFRKTNVFDHTNPQAPAYGDFDSAEDYMSATQLIMDAEKNFAALPAEIRQEMNNDPNQYLAFVGNPDNTARAIELGMINAPPVDQVDPGTEQHPVVNPPTVPDPDPAP